MRPGTAPVQNTSVTQHGFTLLEVMVAFLIAAIALAALFRGASAGIQATRVADRYQEAVSRARSHLASIADTGALAVRTEQGDDGHGFRWRVNVESLGVVRCVFDREDAEPPPRRVELFRISVTESWGGDTGLADAGVRAQGRQVQLVSERLQPMRAARAPP